MKLTLNRVHCADTYTIGKLFLNGEYFCDTLEDACRDINRDGDIDDIGEAKVYGKTAIPSGEYLITMGLSPRFGRILPRLQGVAHFDGVLIHAGNTAEDTHGCILVGKNTEVGKVTASRSYERMLVEKLNRATTRIVLTIIDKP